MPICRCTRGSQDSNSALPWEHGQNFPFHPRTEQRMESTCFPSHPRRDSQLHNTCCYAETSIIHRAAMYKYLGLGEVLGNEAKGTGSHYEAEGKDQSNQCRVGETDRFAQWGIQRKGQPRDMSVPWELLQLEGQENTGLPTHYAMAPWDNFYLNINEQRDFINLKIFEQGIGHL